MMFWLMLCGLAALAIFDMVSIKNEPDAVRHFGMMQFVDKPPVGICIKRFGNIVFSSTAVYHLTSHGTVATRRRGIRFNVRGGCGIGLYLDWR